MLNSSNQLRFCIVLVGLFLSIATSSISQSYDLALVLEETNPGTYAIGDQVSHTITICNQGNFSASTIEVIDHIPAGMSLSQADINGWTGPSSGPVTNTISAIPAGVCTTLDILLIIGPSVVSASMVNHAEISQDNGNDIDSSPDSILGNDAGGAPNSPADNMMFGSGTGSPGDEIASTDEDDHDSEMILIQAPSLSLDKIGDQSGISNPPQVGEVIQYNFTICNTGTDPINNISVSDPLVSITGLPISLAPGACNNTGFTGAYVLTFFDIEAESVTNTASAQGTVFDGESITALSTEITVFGLAEPANPMIETADGDVYVGNAVNGVILTAPNGLCYRLRVENGGILEVEQVTCP